MLLTFHHVDPADDAALREWYDVRAAAHEVDHHQHMVAINDAIGFVAVERFDEWQLDL